MIKPKGLGWWFNMVGDFDTPRYFQRSSICCEVLFRAERHPLESSAWYSRVHQWYFWFWHYVPARDISRYFYRGFADADYASKSTDRRSVSGGAIMSRGTGVCLKKNMNASKPFKHIKRFRWEYWL